jgi:hypothetical protein
MWRRVGLVRTDVWDDLAASILWVERNSELATALAVTSKL